MSPKPPLWLRRAKKSASLPDPTTPLPIGARSNGEYFHPESEHDRRIRARALAHADALGRRLGLDRREFMATSLGMAATLSAINACGGSGGGASSDSGSTGGTTGGQDGADTLASTSGNGYDLGADATGSSTSGGGDCTPLDHDVFVLDVQTHHVDPTGSWRESNPIWLDFFEGVGQAQCGLPMPLDCLGQQPYLDLMFLGSNTTVAVLSSIPTILCSRTVTTDCGSPLDNAQIVETRELVNMLASSQRCLNHCMVTPNVDLPAQLDIMQMVHEEAGVAGWKCYPPWGPTGTGWWLDDPAIGIPFIDKARELGVKILCIHKGIPLPSFDSTHTHPRDVGVVAALYPDVKFIVYHSAWLHGGFGNGEGPYDPDGLIDPMNPVLYPVDMGVNSLIAAVQDAGLGTGSNVYAELGSVWTNLLAVPDQAAHVLGKLMLNLGEDNVIWGTDSIWTGSPQPLIEAFWAFQISQEFQDTYGYPALTEQRKRKILGLNGAAVFGIDPDAMRCELDQGALAHTKRWLDAEVGERRWTAMPALGPRTRREFVGFLRSQGGRPG